MSGWIDGAYLQAAIGSPTGYALGLLTTSTGTTTTARFTQYELLARSRVIAVLQHAGYPAPDATLPTYTVGAAGEVTNAFLQQIACSILLNDCFSLVKGIELPEKTQAVINIGVSMADAVYNKKLPVPGMQPTAADAIDGSQFNTDPSYVPERHAPVWTGLAKSSF